MAPRPVFVQVTAVTGRTWQSGRSHRPSEHAARRTGGSPPNLPAPVTVAPPRPIFPRFYGNGGPPSGPAAIRPVQGSVVWICAASRRPARAPAALSSVDDSPQPGGRAAPHASPPSSAVHPHAPDTAPSPTQIQTTDPRLPLPHETGSPALGSAPVGPAIAWPDDRREAGPKPSGAQDAGQRPAGSHQGGDRDLRPPEAHDDERTTLLTFLGYLREALIRKVEGVPDAAASTPARRRRAPA